MDDIYQTGKPVKLDGPLDLGTIQVVLGPNDKPGDAVAFRNGATGHVRAIIIETYCGDGIKVNAGCHDLIVDSVHLLCRGKPDGKHQDGIQVMGGRNVKFMGGYIGGYSVNNSQIMIHTGAGGQEVPEEVVFDSFVLDPQGTGAYGASNGEGIRCGFTNLTLLTLSNLHDLYQGKGTQEPVWDFISLPDGVRANFPLDPPQGTTWDEVEPDPAPDDPANYPE